MWDETTVATTATQLLKLVETEGGPEMVVVPRGYSHLSLAVIDAVFSLQANYDSHVVPVVDAYCATVPALRKPEARFDDTVKEHTLSAMLKHTAGFDEEQLVGLFNGNHQVAPGTKTRKAVTVITVAENLRAVGIDSRAELARSTDLDVERAVRSVPGVGIAAWRYLLSLARIEKSKPDSMITRWVRTASGNSHLNSAEVADVLEGAVRELQNTGCDISVRAADHLVWRFQSGR